MKVVKTLLCTIGVLGLLASPALAAETIKVGAILAETGPSFLGVPP